MSIQNKYEELAKKLYDVNCQRKKVEAVREETTRPIRDQLKAQLTTMHEEYNNILALETELRVELVKLFNEAAAARTAAYNDAIAAQLAGDMEAVREATLKAGELAITPNGNVFFRSKTDFVVEDIAKVPVEYLTVDWDKVKTANKDICGIHRVSVATVAVKE